MHRLLRHSRTRPFLRRLAAGLPAEHAHCLCALHAGAYPLRASVSACILGLTAPCTHPDASTKSLCRLATHLQHSAPWPPVPRGALVGGRPQGLQRPGLMAGMEWACNAHTCARSLAVPVVKPPWAGTPLCPSVDCLTGAPACPALCNPHLECDLTLMTEGSTHGILEWRRSSHRSGAIEHCQTHYTPVLCRQTLLHR